MIIEPLVKALASGEAVAFVGSGASISSGLPDWRKFLFGLLNYAEALHTRGMDSTVNGWCRTRELLESGDFLQAAEMLQRGLPDRVFTSYIESVFGKALEPTDIHRSISRLPFSLVLTTNFDVLLEAAYQRSPSLTWRDRDDVFKAIRSKEFAIVKLHGSVNHVESIRLTRTHYRDSALANPEFNECLRTLLTWKTLLFIGYSLRDSDLLHLVDEARLRFGKNFGPHYAIMPEHEVDEKFRTYLKDAFGIEVISYIVDPIVPNQATGRVTEILTRLAGQVARERFETSGFVRKELAATRAQAVQAILEGAVPLTGSVRGDICLVTSDADPQLGRVASYSFKTGAYEPPEIDHDSVIGTTFLQANANISRDYIYLKDVSAADEELRMSGYSGARYVVCDMDVRSELCYPIIADGRRVGALNLEANVTNAYTDDHVLVVRKIAEELGQIYIQSERRRMRSVPLEGFYRNPRRFDDLLRRSRLIRSLGHEFILYEIDHEGKRLLGHHAGEARPYPYGFDSRSLANKVFEQRHELLVSDAKTELQVPDDSRNSWLNKEGVERFKIDGPVFACPVRLGGQTEAVLVTWINHELKNLPRDLTTPLLDLFRSSCRQVLRLAHLVANDRLGNDSIRAERFLQGLYEILEHVDHNKVWSGAKLANLRFRDGILNALMQAIVQRMTGLKRVRVWKAVTPIISAGDGGTFRCVRSFTDVDHTAHGKDQWNAYAGCQVTTKDVYCRYTVRRFSHDPYARWQHPKMFGCEDQNSCALDKDPKGSWIVAPIVRKEKLLGFFSADNHRQGKQSGNPDFREIAQQCRVMNIVADLAQYVLPIASGRIAKAARNRH